MTRTLDSFETELLDELRAVVAVRATTARERGLDPVPVAPVSPRRPRRRFRAAALLTAAAASTAVVTLHGLVGSPAFAVQQRPDGTIEVQVNRLEDAAGLEAALRELGVEADIRYLGRNLQCAAPRFRDGPVAPGSVTRFSVGDGIELTLDRRDVSSGETVVIAASRITDGVHAEMGIAVGPVARCEPVPIPADEL